jgi:hypothetical protein
MRHKTLPQKIVYTFIAALMLTITTMVFAAVLFYIHIQRQLNDLRRIGNDERKY